MIEDMLLIDFDPFAKESRIINISNGTRSFVTVSSDINELAEQLPIFCQDFNQYKVRFHAPINAFYELKRQLDEVERNVYGENKIELEVC